MITVKADRGRDIDRALAPLQLSWSQTAQDLICLSGVVVLVSVNIVLQVFSLLVAFPSRQVRITVPVSANNTYFCYYMKSCGSLGLSRTPPTPKNVVKGS